MLGEYKTDVVTVLSKVQVRDQEQVEQAQVQRQAPTEVSYTHKEASSALASEPPPAPGTGASAVAAASAAREAAANRPAQAAPQQPYKRDEKKIGRNEPCWCGSGKKFKQCHGKLT